MNGAVVKRFLREPTAIDKGLRGKGVGSPLIDSIEDRAPASGTARLALDVASRNERGRTRYERREMTVESRWPKRLSYRDSDFFR